VLLGEIGRELESCVPSCYSEDWDSVGWMIAPLSEELSGVLLCVDPSPEAFEMASDKGFNLILAHHPMFFNSLDRLREDVALEELAIRAVRRRCGVYSMHTNADSCLGGLNDLFAARLGLENCYPILPAEESSAIGLGRVGELAVPLSGEELEEKILEHPHINHLRSTLCLQRELKKVALCTGSGGDLITRDEVLGADVYISGDIKHHQVEEARLRGLELIIIDHYEMETVFFDFARNILKNKIGYEGPVEQFVRRNPYRHRFDESYSSREEI